jgi:hypothetical protein
VRIEIYGNSPASDVEDFERALRDQCNVLKLQLIVGRPVRKSPRPTERVTVVFVNQSSKWDNGQLEALKQLVDNAEPVLPVIDQAPDAQYMPQALRSINAFKKSDYGTPWAPSLVDEVVGMAWLRRRTRKVFISYKRVDSGEIANQIYHRFSSLGYEVFFDDASIERGVDFQRELKWWLNDADLLLVLLSPQFSDSKWCVEEVSFAQNRKIGVAAIEWPQEIYLPQASIKFAGTLGWKAPNVLNGTFDDQRMRLKPQDCDVAPAEIAAGRDPNLTSRKLTRSALDSIVDLCARQRAVAIRQRLENLIPLVQLQLSQNGPVSRTRTFGDLTYREQKRRPCFVRILPFRPRPENIREAYLSAKGGYLSACAYEECDPHDARAAALRWLAKKTASDRGFPRNTLLWAFYGDKLL